MAITFRHPQFVQACIIFDNRFVLFKHGDIDELTEHACYEMVRNNYTRAIIRDTNNEQLVYVELERS